METIANFLGLTVSELTQLIILVIVLIAGLILLRVLFKLTAALFRLGCFLILLIVTAVLIISWLN
ncbi:MAG: hypothetical protein D6706_20355 [Chloroflexi bacterium]|nr:MAG: hypothetical protein D6706_20355 [Chloroflexota bacterium]